MLTNDNIGAVIDELQRSYPEALELCILRVENRRLTGQVAAMRQVDDGPPIESV